MKSFKQFIAEATYNHLATKEEIGQQSFNKEHLGKRVGTFEGKDHYVHTIRSTYNDHNGEERTNTTVRHRLVHPGSEKAEVTIVGSVSDNNDYNMASIESSGKQNTHGFLKHLVKHHYRGVYADSISPGLDKQFRRYHNDNEVELHGKSILSGQHYQHPARHHDEYYSPGRELDSIGIREKGTVSIPKKSLPRRIIDKINPRRK